MSVRQLAFRVLLVCALLCLALLSSAFLPLGCEGKCQEKLSMKNYLFQSLEFLIRYYIYLSIYLYGILNIYSIYLMYNINLERAKWTLKFCIPSRSQHANCPSQSIRIISYLH